MTSKTELITEAALLMWRILDAKEHGSTLVPLMQDWLERAQEHGAFPGVCSFSHLDPWHESHAHLTQPKWPNPPQDGKFTMWLNVYYARPAGSDIPQYASGGFWNSWEHAQEGRRPYVVSSLWDFSESLEVELVARHSAGQPGPLKADTDGRA